MIPDVSGAFQQAWDYRGELGARSANASNSYGESENGAHVEKESFQEQRWATAENVDQEPTKNRYDESGDTPTEG